MGIYIPVLKTAEDVLAYNGKKPVINTPVVSKPVEDLELINSIIPESVIEDNSKLNIEELVTKLVNQHKKDELIQMCKDAGLEINGNKIILAQALVKVHSKV